MVEFEELLEIDQNAVVFPKLYIIETNANIV